MSKEEAPSVRIEALGEHVDQRVRLLGWLYNRRSSGKILFLHLRDGTGYIQAVAVRDELPGDEFDMCGTVPPESSLIVTGGVRADHRSPGGYLVPAGTGEVADTGSHHHHAHGVALA